MDCNGIPLYSTHPRTDCLTIQNTPTAGVFFDSDYCVCVLLSSLHNEFQKMPVDARMPDKASVLPSPRANIRSYDTSTPTPPRA